MSFFPFNLMKAVAAGAAMETGREAVRRRSGLGFAADERFAFDDYGAYDDYYWLNDYGGSGWDWWFGGGGGDSYDFGGYDDLPFIPMDFQQPDMTAPGGPLANEDRYWFDWGQYLSDWLSGNVETIDTYAPYGRDAGGGATPWGWNPDWLPGPGPAQMDPQYGPAGTGQGLPGYCPQGTYHPQSDPYACVPFPPNDPNAKKQAEQQKKAQQAAMNAAKKIQQQQDKACPKDPQGRPVWRNPQTGKCELVPPCPMGKKFDSATRQCLTPAEYKALYGDDNSWLWWLLGAGAVLVIATRDGGGSGGRRRR